HKLDIFVNSAGTGGTIAGVSSFLKEKSPKTQIVLADPFGSGLYEYFKTGVIKTEGSSVSEGIGIMRITANMSKAKVDEVLRISDEKMWDMVRHVAHHEGYCVGLSSGINLQAAFEVGLRHKNQGLKIVTLICDHGSRYLSKRVS
ncbi:MAG TPA: pyridoxal-phosphate dependent enzyme, partial [Pseudobdellovibrionaceae bacterium]|nr:pyridoxal-phosphate dependent enzyme [Pseudobdellovibrionaceae bacterium]